MTEKARHTKRMTKPTHEEAGEPKAKAHGDGGPCSYHDQLAGWTVRVSMLVVVLPWMAALIAPDRLGLTAPVGMSVVGILMAVFGLCAGSIKLADRRSADLVTVPALGAAVGLVLFGIFFYLEGFEERAEAQIKKELKEPDVAALAERQAPLKAKLADAREGALLWGNLGLVMLAAALMGGGLAVMGYLPRRCDCLCNCG